MREIKFKGMVKFNGNHYFAGEWVKGFYYENDKGEAYIVDTEEDQYGHARYTQVEVDPETVGQFTGLQDKNGKDIYEGDVVEVDIYGTGGNKEIGFVSFSHNSFGVKKDMVGGGWFHSFHYYKAYYQGYVGYEKKGNIHENPEPLREPTHE